MARISGEAASRLQTDETFGTRWMNSQYSWTNETMFGNYTTDSSGQQTWQWNDIGLNSTVFKLMSSAEQLWAAQNGVTVSDQKAAEPSFFTTEFISGLEVTPTAAYQQYSGLIPLVALFKVNWDAYDATLNSATTP